MNRLIEFFRRQPSPPDLDKELAKVVAKHNKDHESSHRFITELMRVVVGDAEEVSENLQSLMIKNIPPSREVLPEERVNKVINLLKKIRVLPEDLIEPIHAELKTVKRGLLSLDRPTPGNDDSFVEMGWTKPSSYSSYPVLDGPSYQPSEDVKRHELIDLLKKYKALLLIIHELLFPLAE